MKTLVIYASKYGATAQCAEAVAQKLNGEAALCNLTAGDKPNLSTADGIIVGSPIYMGRACKEISRFIKKNEKLLLEKPLGLFLCCIQDMDQSLSGQFSSAFPKPLREHACVLGALGGAVNFTKLKGFDKLIMNMIAGDLRKRSGGSVVTTLSSARIAQFVETYEKA